MFLTLILAVCVCISKYAAYAIILTFYATICLCMNFTILNFKWTLKQIK